MPNETKPRDGLQENRHNPGNPGGLAWVHRLFISRATKIEIQKRRTGRPQRWRTASVNSSEAIPGRPKAARVLF
jgi:hypothetical protein